MRPRILYATVLVFAVVWLAFHWNRLTAADPFADPVAMHRMPDQSLPPVDEALDKLSTHFLMSDPDADLIIGKDIQTGGAPQRWTFANPTMKFILGRVEGQRFAMDFEIVDATFKTTGPLTLTVSVNDHKLGDLACNRSGSFHFEQPVPAEWLTTTEPNTVKATVDKLWIAPADHAQLGYLLSGAGFLH